LPNDFAGRNLKILGTFFQGPVSQVGSDLLVIDDRAT